MDVKQTIIQVIIAALAVIGFYGILHAIFETALCPKQITAAVVLVLAEILISIILDDKSESKNNASKAEAEQKE